MSEEAELESARPRVKRPFLFVLALSLSVVVGWGGVANGCNTVQIYRGNTVIEQPLDAKPRTKKQEEADAFEKALLPVHDHARSRRLPLGIANLLLSGLLVFAATRALGGRPGAKGLAEQALLANSVHAIAELALSAPWRREVAQTLATHFPTETSRSLAARYPSLVAPGADGLSEAQVAASMSAALDVGYGSMLVLLLVLFGVALLTLRSRGALLFFASTAEDFDEQED